MTRSPAALTARLAALAAAAGLGVALLYVLAVRTGGGRRLDDLTWGSFAPGSRAVEGTKDLLNTISVSSLALLGLAIMAVALLRARPRVALGAGVLVLGANLTTHWLKATLGRPGIDEAGTYPSGHVTVAMSLAMALVLVAPPWARPVAALLGTAYASAIGVGVIAASWHRPSDVVGAYLVVVGWTAAVTAVLAGPAGAGELRRGAPTARRTAGLGAAAAALLGAAFLAVVAVGGLARRPRAPRRRPHGLRRGRRRLRRRLRRPRGGGHRPGGAGVRRAGRGGRRDHGEPRQVGSRACASECSPAGATAPA